MQFPSIPYIEADEDNPMPSLNHARVAQNLAVLLHNTVSDRFEIYQQLTLRLKDWPSIPDLALYSKGAHQIDWLADRDEVSEPPVLVIEILSQHQVLGNLVNKIRQYLESGVKSCWLVEPATRVVSVFPASGGSRSFAEGDVKDEALGISVPLSGVFR
jgi:Uma2 family endonuclease